MARLTCLVALLAFVSAVQGFHNLKQQNITDSCLWNVYQGTQLIPKIVDDLTRGDILSLMTDVMSFIPLINATKGNCSQFDFLDVMNRTTINVTMDCYHSAESMVSVFKLLIDDVSAGNYSAVIRDVTWILGNLSTTGQVCQSALQVLMNPRNLANFWNSTACWGIHERSVAVLQEIIYQVQKKNYTAILPLIMPMIGTSAETIRQCSIWPNNSTKYSHNNFSYPEFMMFENFHAGDSSQCTDDIHEVFDKVIPTFIEDFNTKQWLKLSEDLLQSIPIFKKLVADCLSYRPNIMQIMPYLNKTLIQRAHFCLSDVKHLKEDALSIIKKAIQSGPESVMFEIMGLVGNGQRVFNGCTNNGRFYDPKTILNYFPSEFCTQAQNKAGDVTAQMVVAFITNKSEFIYLLPELLKSAKTVLEVCHRDSTSF